MNGQRLHIEILDIDAGTTRDVDIEPGEALVTIGRDRGSSVVLNSPSVSRQHCRLELRGERWEAIDSSTLGTECNGEPLSKETWQPIGSGDLLVCANFELRFSFLAVTDPTLKPDQGAFKRLMEEVEGIEATVPPRIWLVSDGTVQSHDLDPEGTTITIGRSSECDVQLADPMRVISSVHAKIERNWAGIILYDSSRNGLFVNGQRVQDQVVLNNGDRITVSVAEESDERPLFIYTEEGNDAEPTGVGGSFPGPTETMGGLGEPASDVADGASVPGAAPVSATTPVERLASDSPATGPDPSLDDLPGSTASMPSGNSDPGATAGIDSHTPESLELDASAASSPVPAPKPSFVELVKSNLLVVLVLVVSGLALLTVLIWGLILLNS